MSVCITLQAHVEGSEPGHRCDSVMCFSSQRNKLYQASGLVTVRKIWTVTRLIF